MANEIYNGLLIIGVVLIFCLYAYFKGIESGKKDIGKIKNAKFKIRFYY